MSGDLIERRQRLAACILLSAFDLPANAIDAAEQALAAASVCPGVKMNEVALGQGRRAGLIAAKVLVDEMVGELEGTAAEQAIGDVVRQERREFLRRMRTLALTWRFSGGAYMVEASDLLRLVALATGPDDEPLPPGCALLEDKAKLLDRLEQWPAAPQGRDALSSAYVGEMLTEAAGQIRSLQHLLERKGGEAAVHG